MSENLQKQEALKIKPLKKNQILLPSLREYAWYVKKYQFENMIIGKGNMNNKHTDFQL